MKPAPFGYHRASTVDEAVRLLDSYDGTARVIAGGQSLVPMLNMRLLRPDALIDVNGIRALSDITVDGAGLVVGALVRYTTLERSAVVGSRLPLLTTVVRHIGDRQVRNRGTIGGSLAHGDPTGEMPLACLTLGASVRVHGRRGVRDIGMDELYETSYASTLDPCEVLAEVRFPASPRHAAFVETGRRHNDFALISCAAVGDRTADGTWHSVRIGLAGVADTPVLARAAMAAVEGLPLSDEVIDRAGRSALEVADPPSDVRGSADYRRHLVPIYVARALRQLAATP